VKRHALTAGQPLAIDPKAIRQDADGFFIMLGPGTPDNERHGSVAVVHIRGALAHFREDGGESYEGILDRVKAALTSDDGPPSALVFRIESPGGVVSGLAETTKTLQALSKSSGVPFYAYVDELASSAAYHLCCACEEILAPPSAVVGSVGVISTMVSLVKQDAMQGVEVKLITSGARKADGHLHAPISEGAAKAEEDRNGKLAAQFFNVVREARGMSVEEIRGLEAGIYLAKDAQRIGLIDDVASFDEVLEGLDAQESRGPAPKLGEGNVTDRRAKEKQTVAQLSHVVSDCANSEALMPVKLKSLISRTEAAIATEQDAKKRNALAAQLAQYQATRVAMESDPETEPDGDEDEDDDESKSAKHAKMAEKHARKAEAEKHKAKAAEHRAKAAEYDEAAKQCMDEDAEGAEDDDDAALVPSVQRSASSAALADHVESQQNIRIAKLESDLAERDKATLVSKALAAGEITPAQAKKLADKSPKFVSEYLETTKGMRVVATGEGHLLLPKDAATGPATPADAELAEINGRIKAMGVTDPAKAEAMRNDMITNRRRLQNGEAGRY
jgi:signal peptide peptidase SppA